MPAQTKFPEWSQLRCEPWEEVYFGKLVLEIRKLFIQLVYKCNLMVLAMPYIGLLSAIAVILITTLFFPAFAFYSIITICTGLTVLYSFLALGRNYLRKNPNKFNRSNGAFFIQLFSSSNSPFLPPPKAEFQELLRKGFLQSSRHLDYASIGELTNIAFIWSYKNRLFKDD